MPTVHDIESKLLTILQMVNDWLKFAEAKNAGLLVFIGASIAGILTFVASASVLPAAWKSGLLIGVGVLCLSSLVTLFSFLPRTKLEKVLAARKGVRKDTDNLYFYGDLCKYSCEDLVDSIARLYFPDLAPKKAAENKERLDIAAQIVANSQIAMRKYILFKVALWIAILGVLSIPVATYFKS